MSFWPRLWRGKNLINSICYKFEILRMTFFNKPLCSDTTEFKLNRQIGRFVWMHTHLTAYLKLFNDWQQHLGIHHPLNSKYPLKNQVWNTWIWKFFDLSLEKKEDFIVGYPYGFILIPRQRWGRTETRPTKTSFPVKKKRLFNEEEPHFFSILLERVLLECQAYGLLLNNSTYWGATMRPFKRLTP